MTELVTYSAPSADEWAQNKELVNIVAKTDFVPKAMRGSPAAVLACVMTGREVGIGPMQSLKHIALIEGKAGMSAELMSALVHRAGHKLRTVERDNVRVTVEGTRYDDPDHTERVTWTIKDAERAKLSHKDVWQKYPQAMLWSRAVSQLCRGLFADVLAGVSYTPEELDGISEPTTTVEVGEPIANTQTGEVIDWDQPSEVNAQRMKAAQQEATEVKNGPPPQTPEGGAESHTKGGDDSSGHTPSGNLITDWMFKEQIQPGQMAAAAAFLRRKDANLYGRTTARSLQTLPDDKAKEVLPLLLEWHAQNQEAEA